MLKRNFILTVNSLIILLLVGCSPKMPPNKTPDVMEEQVESDDANEEVIEEFRKISKDTTAPDILIQFVDEHISEVSTQHADEMIDMLRSTLETNKQFYEERLVELDFDNELLSIDGSEAIFTEASISKIENVELKKEVEYLYSNYYQLINLEGAFYPVVNYSKLKKYEEYLSEEFKRYLEIKSLELENRSMVDGELTISFEELAERIYKAEEYLKVAIPGERKDDILEEYFYKINAYLKGLPSTPIREDETSKIKETVLKSYQNTVNKDYMISIITKDYLEILDNNDYLVDDSTLEQADALIIEAKRSFDNE